MGLDEVAEAEEEDMNDHELELIRRSEAGDATSAWALSEIALLVEKANEAVRKEWELRERLAKATSGSLSSASVMDPVVVAT